MRYFIVFFSLAVLFTLSFEAPTTADLSILHTHSHYLGKIQQDPVPDPGIRDYINKLPSGMLNVIAKGLKNSDLDTKKIEAFKQKLKEMRKIASPFLNFIRQYYPDNILANGLADDSETFLSSLEKLIEEASVPRKDIESLAKLMRMLEAVTS